MSRIILEIFSYKNQPAVGMTIIIFFSILPYIDTTYNLSLKLVRNFALAHGLYYVFPSFYFVFPSFYTVFHCVPLVT